MERDIVKRIEDLMDLFDEGEVTTADQIQRPEDPFRDFNERNPLAGGGRIGFSDGPDLRKRAGGAFANKTKEEIAEIMAKRTPTRTITKEENIKKIFDKIFDEENFSGIKNEFPGLSRAEQKAGINKYDPSRKGKTGGKIPNQYYTRIVGPAVQGDVDALNDLARITGRTVDQLKDAFSKRDLKTVRSEAAAKSSAKLNPVNRKLADLVRSGVVDKKTIKKTLNISEDKFQKSIATLFKISYGNRRQINKGNKITSYVGNTAEEITNLLQKLKQVDGVDQVVQRRNITQILDDLFGKEGTMPNSNSYKIMMKRVDEFYKLRALLPEGIKLNLDHPLPEVLIQQLEKSAPTALRANVQPITQALNLGLKSKIDTAYANAYDLASRGDVNAKKIMGAIDEVAEKIGLPLGKVTDKYVDLGKNPFLSGDLKRVIVDNLKAQNLIVSKFEALDPKLKQRAGLDRLKNINIPQINIKEVEQAFGISNEGGFIDRQLLTYAGEGLQNLGRTLVKYGIAPEVAFLGAEQIIRTGLGDTPKEAFLRTTDFIRLGDQTKEADVLKASRLFGDKAGLILGKVIDNEKQLRKIESLKQQKKSLEALSKSDFGYLPETTLNIKKLDNALKQATFDLNNKFKVTDAEKIYANRIRSESFDRSLAKSYFTKGRLESAFSPDPRKSGPQAMQDAKSQMDLNLKMLPTPPKIFTLNEDMSIGKKNLSEASLDEILQDTQISRFFDPDNKNLYQSRPLLQERDRLRGMLPSQVAQEFSPEQAYGFSETFGGEPVRPTPLYDFANGGIAGLSGGDKSGPPPVRGPNPQGLLSLKNRVRNL